MKFNFSKIVFNESDALSRSQMKKIKGGYTPSCYEGASSGDSCWHDASWSNFECGLTNAEAQERQAESGGFWCHDSCVDSCLKSGI